MTWSRSPDPAETRDYRAPEEGTVIVCVGAEPVGDHPYGEWIGEGGRELLSRRRLRRRSHHLGVVGAARDSRLR